jgi:glycosyltransferase involved in cell wall biosynthesis
VPVASTQMIVHVAKVAGISGAENHLLLLLPQLRERGWDARLVLLHEDEPGALEFASRLQDAGVPLESIRLRRPASPIAFQRLARLARRTRPAIFHTHLVHADFYGLIAGKLARVPVLVSTKHGFNPFRASRAFALLDRGVGRLADVQLAISQGLARYLAETEGFAESDFQVVHYGIEAGLEPRPFTGEEPRLVCVGRLIPIKGHDVLLRALAEARRSLAELSLDVVGSGPLETELRARVSALGLDGAVRFHGRVSPIARSYEDAALVVVPSLGEGFGMVALEAMERGRPVIASAVGGLPEIVSHGETGLVVPPGDAPALAAAIVELASDLGRARELGAAGRRRALASFRQERCTDRHEALYLAALARAGLAE